LYNGKSLNGGGAMTLRFTTNHLSNLDFKNNLSEMYGGSILFSYTYVSSLNHTVFTNSTSRTQGNAFYVLTDDSDATRISLNDITQVGNCNVDKDEKYSIEGTFFSAFGKFHIDIEHYNGSNLCYGPFMSFEGDVIAKLYNSNVENVYSINDGPIVKAVNPNQGGVNVDFINCSFKNIFQDNDSYSALITSVNTGLVKFAESSFSNLSGIKSGLVMVENRGRVSFNGVNISDIYSRYPEPLFNVNYKEQFHGKEAIIFYNSSIRNVYQDGVLFYLNNCWTVVWNSNFYNIHECFKYNDCNSFSEPLSEKFESAIFYHPTFSKLDMKNNKFDQVYGRYGNVIGEGLLTVEHCDFTNSNFTHGFFYYPPSSEGDEVIISTYNFEDVLFSNNVSHKGTVFHFGNAKAGFRFYSTLSNVRFMNNRAEKYGGVLYSEIKDFPLASIVFSQCVFEGNEAELGKISYVHDNDHDVKYLMNIDGLKKDSNNFVTNPSYLVFDDYDDSFIEIYSGDRIEEYS